MLPKLCHLDNDLVITIGNNNIIIIFILQCIYLYCVVHMTYIPRPGDIFFSRYPSVALARNLYIGEKHRPPSLA